MSEEERFYFNPAAKGLEVFLGPTEAALMELAWEHESLTVKRALYFLDDNRDRAYTTVMTVLKRLADKGLLVRKKAGRGYVYSPAVDRKSFLRDRIETVKACLKQEFSK